MTTPTLQDRLLRLPRRAAILMAGLSLIQGALAQDLYWDADGDGSTTVGGTGPWDLSSSLWRDGSDTGPLGLWNNASPSTATANFGGTAGTVTINAGTAINVNNMAFGVSGYTIAGTDATSTLNFSGATPTINTGSASATISAIIASGGFAKAGSGTLTLSGANTYAGGTILDAGSISVSNASAIGTGTLTINGGVFGMVSSLTSLTLSSNNAQAWNGNFTFNPGGGSQAHFNLGTGNVTLGGNITVNVLSNTGVGRTTVGGVISDGGNGHSLTVTSIGSGQSGSNQLILSGSNTYSGGTILNSGGITINNNSALGTGALTINGGALAVSTGQSRTLSNEVILNSALAFGNSNTVNAAGTLTLAAPTLTLNATRSVIIHQGTLNISSVIDDGADTFGINYAGGRFAVGTLRLNAANTFDGGLTVQTSGNRTLLNIGNAGALGTGTLTLTGGSAATGNNSIRVNNVTGSALTLTTNNAQNWDTDFIFGMDGNGSGFGSSLNMGTGAVSLGSTSASLTRTVNIHSNVLTVGGVISNGVTTDGITKIGNGTLAFAGANDYTGDTVVNAGLLRLEQTGELRFVIEDGNVSNQLLGLGSVELDGILRLDISGFTEASGSWGLIDVANLSETYGATFGLAFVGGPSFTDEGGGVFTSGGWTFDQSTGFLTAAIPEPQTSLLAGAGLLAIFLRRKSRR